MMRDCCPCGRETTSDPSARPRWATWCCSRCQGLGKRHSLECDEEYRAAQQAGPLVTEQAADLDASQAASPAVQAADAEIPSAACLEAPRRRTRRGVRRCTCGRDLEFDPALRPGMPTWCCKYCQGTDRRHSAECDQERSDLRLRPVPCMAAPDRDPWATRSAPGWAHDENLRCEWVRWLTPHEVKKEFKSDSQRRQDGFCS